MTNQNLKKINSDLNFVYSDNGSISIVFHNNDLLMGVVGEFNKHLKELEELRNLNKKIKVQNEQLKAENERLKLLSAKTLKENEASKQLIVELLKENEKIKLAKEIFKKEILENQNKEILKKIEEEVSKPVINKFRLLMFLLVLVSIIFTFGFLITRISIKLFKI